jgi:hypothetical protein
MNIENMDEILITIPYLGTFEIRSADVLMSLQNFYFIEKDER